MPRSLSATEVMSNEQAMSIAREVVGPHVLKAEVCLSKDSGRQYIAAEDAAPHKFDYDGHALVILEVTEGAYRLKETFVVAPDEDYLDPYKKHIIRGVKLHHSAPIDRWGFVDIDGNGDCSVYALDASYGSGGGGHKIQIYSINSNTIGYVWINYQWGRSPGPLEIKVTPGSSQPAIYDWLRARSEKLISDLDLSQDHTELGIWEKNHGRGYYYGPVKVHRVPGKLTPSSIGNSVYCRVKDGIILWYSMFKEAVYAYDAKKNSHFLVYAPRDNYDYVTSMVAGRAYLWLGAYVKNIKSNKMELSILAYHKKTSKLETIPIEVPKRILDTSFYTPDSEEYYGAIKLSEKLSSKNGVLLIDNTPIKLPKSIGSGEFKDAHDCL